MTAPVFVDTNVFVYRFDTTDVEKQLRAQAWLDHLWRGRLGRTSTQVQHELYATLTRRLGMPREEGRRIVTALDAWKPVMTDRGVVDRAWRLEDRYSLAWWDALIVAAAQAAAAEVLLTEDLQAAARYDTVRVVNPFEVAPPVAGVHEREATPYD